MYKHDRADILDIMHRDLQALSDVLGDKKFVMGDEPTSVSHQEIFCAEWIDEQMITG
jgi:hypothetical protein